MLDTCDDSLKKFLLCWKRYIDDVFLIWCGSYEDLEKFHNHLNSVHPTMKFDDIEHDKSENSCNFLDLTIKIHDGKISTDLFRKQTDKPTALLPSSAHPGHITNNIVYSMAFRILRICSEQEIFEKRLDELKNEFLIPRNYKAKLIDEQFSRIKNLPGIDFKEKRKEALKKVKKQTKQSNRIIAPLDFNPHLPIPSKILQKHHRALLASAPPLANIFPEPPMPAYRQPPNLRNLLCKCKLYPA